MEQHYKRYKGSQKHFNFWMLSETEEFYPTQIPNDPLKKISEQMKSRLSNLLESKTEKEVHQRETKRKLLMVPYKADFNALSYWEKFSKDFNLELAKFLGLYETIALASTCKSFKQVFEEEAIWSWFLRKDFHLKMFDNPRKEEKELRSIKLYYKYLYIKERVGIPYHTGYFKTFGVPEVMELVDGMVDFMVPKRENIKRCIQEIMLRNRSKMMEIRLSWLKETGEICVWNADFSITFEEKLNENMKVKTIERVNRFYPCFIKKYLVEEGKVEEAYFLEDQFLVIKFLNNLEQEELRNFYLEEGTGKLQQRNWNIHKDKLIILSPTHIFCHKISFENQKISPAFYREILFKDPPPSMMPWIFQDDCFTIIALSHPFFNPNTSKLTLIVTSTQEFFHNSSNTFNKINHLITTNDILDRPDRWDLEKENFTENIKMRFQDEKFFVLGERSNFYFDLSAVYKQDKAVSTGWNSNSIEMNSINYNNNTQSNNIQQKAHEVPVKVEEIPKETNKEIDEEKNKKSKGNKFVNYMKLEENRNISGAKEKGNGWSKNGKSDLAKEQDKEKKAVKSKGDKYFKNIRQGKRSEKVN